MGTGHCIGSESNTPTREYSDDDDSWTVYQDYFYSDSTEINHSLQLEDCQNVCTEWLSQDICMGITYSAGPGPHWKCYIHVTDGTGTKKY